MNRQDPPPAQRRSLSHVGGETTTQGDRVFAAALAEALDVPTSLEAEDAARAHVHGFHSYPARMHPMIARRLVEALTAAGDVVLDPFCGSGTVLVEARLAGCGAIGVDANPLAVRLAELKAHGIPAEDGVKLVEMAREIAAKATARRKARAGASRRYEHVDVATFSPHVLLELDSLRLGLDELPNVALRHDLELVLSSILTKVSRKTSDTSEGQLERRIAAGYPAKLFTKKAEELARRAAEVADALLAAPKLDVRLGDARRLEGIPDGVATAAITSPPYPGNYDYLAHHATRLRWLGLDPLPLQRNEIGARRHLETLGPEDGRDIFADDLTATLTAVARKLTPRGRAAMLIADSVISNEAVYAADVVQDAAERAGYAVVAVASQPRPHFHAASQRAFQGQARAEHLVLLQKEAAPQPAPAPPPPARRPPPRGRS